MENRRDCRKIIYWNEWNDNRSREQHFEVERKIFDSTEILIEKLARRRFRAPFVVEKS